MATLTTDFIKIAQAGPCIDGRTLRDDWLRDIAATYNPATYTAMLWPEHCRWCGNMGEVLEVKDGPDEQGVYSLFARMAPNTSLLEYNAAGQGLFYSLEIAENFANSGKAYLEGLGVTDSPASLGLQSTRFSARPATTFIGNVPFSSLLAPAPPAAPRQEQKDEVPGWFKRHFPVFFTTDSAPAQNAPANEEQNMEDFEARVAALEEAITRLAEQAAALDTRLAELEVEVAAANGTADAPDDPAYKALARELGRFRAEIRELSATVQAGTKVPPTTAPAETKKVL